MRLRWFARAGAALRLPGLLLALANGVLNRRHLAARAATEDDVTQVLVEKNDTVSV